MRVIVEPHRPRPATRSPAAHAGWSPRRRYRCPAGTPRWRHGGLSSEGLDPPAFHLPGELLNCTRCPPGGTSSRSGAERTVDVDQAIRM